LTDLELVRLVLEGDQDAFGMLMERHRNALVGTAFLMTKDQEVVSEVMQDTLLRVWQGLPGFRGRYEGSFKSWVLRILGNEVRQRSRIKRVATMPIEDVQGIVVASDNTEQEVLEEEEKSALKQALGVLSPEHQEVLVMHYYLDLPLSGSAETLGMREGTVKSRLHRALQKLQKELAGRGVRGVR
jgi:RNA polymerase sigma-70 factor, ECF subfamily